MGEHRDRASGWQYAKYSGHENEWRVKQLLDNDPEYADDFLYRIGVSGAKIIGTSIGGLHETNVPSVTGTRKTKSKTDLKVFLDDDSVVNVSVKKSLGGQVYLISAEAFVAIFEKRFGKSIPNSVRKAMALFWAAADDAVDIIEEYADRSNERDFMLQLRHRSLNAATLRAYDRKLYNKLLGWFTENADRIAWLCFSMGAVRDSEEWAQFVWYKNMVDDDADAHDVDELFPINDICDAVYDCAEIGTCYGTKNGGTTIQLPFGFVQWHQGCMQFHHDYWKLKNLLG